MFCTISNFILQASIWFVYVCRSSRLAEIKAGHKRYAVQHLKNSSTRGVLAAAFTPAVADEYMTNVMFDTPQE